VKNFMKTELTQLSAAVLWMGLAASGFGVQPGLPGGQSVTIAWTASPDPTVVGYNLYYGGSSGTCTNKADAGTNTAFAIGGLVAGQTYYFSITSYNSSGIESIPTPQITYLVPGILALSQSVTNDAMNVSFPVAPGHSYELQASSDLQTWSNIWALPTQATNVWVEFNEPCTNAVAGRFYRLISD
jgi:hypothetical protein